MKLKLICPPELIKTLIVLRRLGYEKDKDFYVKNIEQFDIELDFISLEKTLKEKFANDYYAFGQWYFKNTKLSQKESEHLTGGYNKILKTKQIILDDFLSKQNLFTNSFKKIVLFYSILFMTLYKIYKGGEKMKILS